MVAKGTITMCEFYKGTEKITKAAEGEYVKVLASVYNAGTAGKVCLTVGLHKKSDGSLWKNAIPETQIDLASGGTTSRSYYFYVPNFDLIAKAYGGHVE